MSKKIRLSKYAELMTVTPQTALRWYNDGKIPYPTERPSQRIILVEIPDDFNGADRVEPQQGKTIAYCRVSTQSQKTSLDNQELSIYKYANSHGITIDKTVKEIGSGFNERRKKMGSILSDPDVTTIIVEHRERLARSNFTLIEKSLSAQGRKIIVVNDDELHDDLATEITEFMSSVCGKLYGRRGAERIKNKVDSAIKTEENSGGDNDG